MSDRDDVAAKLRAQLVSTEALAASLRTTLRLLTGEAPEPVVRTTLRLLTGEAPEPVEPEALLAPAPAATTPLPRNKKRCARCKQVKARSEFGVNNTTADKLQYYCRPCLRGAQAAGRRKAKAKRSAPAKAEEPEPVRARTRTCPRCRRTMSIALFHSEAREATTVQCRQCLDRLSARKGGQHDVGSEEDRAARMQRIKDRVKARGVARGFARCLYVREPHTRGDAQLVHQDACGALVFKGDELDHLDDVHDLRDLGADKVAAIFVPVDEHEPASERTWREKRRRRTA